MPLPKPDPREPVHTRRVITRGFHRQDGMWDIEGELHDSKHYPLQMTERGLLSPGEPVHGLSLRLTIDEDYLVHAVAVATDHTPYAYCQGGADNYQRLVGLRIGRGWRRAVRERLGGAQGCTHLVEMLDALATTAFQSIFPAQGGHLNNDQERRPKLLDSCRAFGRGSPVVFERWPQWYQQSDAEEDA